VSSLVIVGSSPCSVAPVASGGRGALCPAHVVVFRGLSLAAGTIPTDSTCPALVEQFHSDDCQKVPRMSFISNALFNFGEVQVFSSTSRIPTGRSRTCPPRCDE
jgi:hypothetical protein